MTKAEERSAARDFVMARLAACRASLAAASVQLDMCLAFFVDPDNDKKGGEREDLLKEIDEDIGIAAVALHAAQEVWPDVDAKEGEPEPEEEEDGDEEEDDEDDEER